MKHLKLLEPGFTKLTGPVGAFEFVDGVSVEPLSDSDAARICSSMRAAFVDGGNPSIASKLVTEKDVRAEVVEPMKTIDKLPPEKEVAKKEPKYTREYLELVADEKGINGLREIAKKHDVKGASIAALIDGLANLG